MAAGTNDQLAGPLPGLNRPAFSYLVLGALRGWADGNGDGNVSAREVLDYSRRALRLTVKSRVQTPTLSGPPDSVIAASAGENSPDLAALGLGGSP